MNNAQSVCLRRVLRLFSVAFYALQKATRAAAAAAARVLSTKNNKRDLILKLREEISKAFIHLSQHLVCSYFFPLSRRSFSPFLSCSLSW